MKKIFFTLLLGMFLSQSSVAKTNTSVDDVIKSSFSGVNAVEPKQIILTKEQFSQVQSRAKAAVRTKIYRYYDIKSGSKSLGYAVLISREVRSKKATVLYVFDDCGTLKFTEIMAFGEPPEYIPGKTWMGQLQNRDASAILTVGKDIPTVSGSTLSARSITEGARIARAIYEIVIK
ncbi:FMN-binding protein [Sulfurovum sp.]|uniref:FMN-binding protein n=1 Tax=Sulfurovum sp. TaxID=1969726 RepID=UPI0028680092|nr:FMN-binding protein [Sulfurovum sp.]